MFVTQEERIAYLVNLALDGDDEPLNAESDKVIRGKAKAMIVKIKRGSIERPPVPLASAQATPLTVSTATNQESEEELISRLVKDGVGGSMDEINSLDNKVLRGKIKSAIIREKRANK